VVFVVVAAVATAIVGWICRDRLTQLEQHTAIVAGQARAFLTAWMDARLAAVATLADRPPSGYAEAPDAFRADARVLLERWPGLRALNWVDADGVIRVVVPEAGNQQALGGNLFQHPSADVARALREAAGTGHASRTATVDLLQGGRGFAFYWPLRRADGALAGFLNGVVDADALVESSSLAAELGDGHWLALRDPDGTVTWSNAPGEVSAWRLGSMQRLPILGLDWELGVAPTPERIRAAVAAAPLVTILAISWLLAALLALAVYRRQRGIDRIRASERTLRELFDQLPHPVYLADDAGRLRFVNHALAAMAGRPAAALQGSDLGALWQDPTDAEAFRQASRAVLVDGKGASQAAVGVTDATGRRRRLEMVRSRFRDPLSDAPAVLGIGVDVTARHEQEALSARIASALDQAGDAIAVLDARGRIEFANTAFLRMMEVGDRDVRGLGVEAFAVPGSDDAQLIEEIGATLRRGEVWQRRYTSTWADGDRVRDASVAPFLDADGRVAGYVAVLRDMTREVLLEEELRQAQKLDALGRLSGGVAHDFNNLLTVILGFAEMLQDQMPGDDPPAAAVAEIRKAAERAAELTRKLLAFSRRGARAASADLNQVVAGLMVMVERLIGGHIDIEVELDDAATWVAADSGEIEQIVVNLCLNARDAMPGGGRIHLSTARRRAQDAPPGLRPRLSGGDFAVVTVRDEGCGMSTEVQQRIFEPFFTTKAVGAGTGLGLSTVYGIVEQRGGAVQVDSTPGSGTTMAIWLPLAQQPPEA
jgi:PAS domain S-box-containing protein